MELTTSIKLSLPPDDFDKVIKCLKLTQSDKDGEVIASIAAVNRILKKNNLSWERIWGEMISQITREIEERINLPTIDQILRELLKTIRPGSFRAMIESFDETWRRTGSLSEKQRKVLIDTWHRHKNML
jgi:hypothetical protein